MKKFVTASEAREILGITKDALAGRRRRGTIESKPNPNGVGFLYLVDDDSATVVLDDLINQDEELEKDDWRSWSGVEHDEPYAQNDAAIDMDDEAPKYFYNSATDRYVFHLDALSGRAFAISGQIARNAVQNYSNDGGKATVAELMRAHGWTRAVTIEILERLGIQHTSLPFTPEELRDREEGDLVASLLSLKAQKVHVKAEKEYWKGVIKKADAFDRLQDQIIQPVVDAMSGPAKTVKRAIRKPKRNACDVFIMPSDLHVGKNGWALEVGSDYGIDVTRTRLMSALDDLKNKLGRFCDGSPRRIITGVGSDFFHIDNYAGGTTRGTRQDTDGSVARVYHEGTEIWRDFIEGLREIAPVDMFAMGGNHDLLLSFTLIKWCEAYWKECKDVNVFASPAARSYTMAGKTLVGISHSEDTKHGDLPLLMAKEAREMWGKSKHGVYFTGHWHQDLTKEIKGTKVHVIPSLSGTDRWHSRNGYVGNHRILPAYVLDHEDGEIAQINGIPAV